MDNVTSDKENIRLGIELATALLVFISTIAAIVNNRLQKARTVAHRQRIISITLLLFAIGFCIAAFICAVTTRSPLLVFWLMIGGVTSYVIFSTGSNTAIKGRDS